MDSRSLDVDKSASLQGDQGDPESHQGCAEAEAVVGVEHGTTVEVEAGEGSVIELQGQMMSGTHTLWMNSARHKSVTDTAPRQLWNNHWLDMLIQAKCQQQDL